MKINTEQEISESMISFLEDLSDCEIEFLDNLNFKELSDEDIESEESRKDRIVTRINESMKGRPQVNIYFVNQQTNRFDFIDRITFEEHLHLIKHLWVIQLEKREWSSFEKMLDHYPSIDAITYLIDAKDGYLPKKIDVVEAWVNYAKEHGYCWSFTEIMTAVNDAYIENESTI